jgi:DNA-binding NtrC family response regulator
MAHTWPGNVRELKNIIQRAVALSQGDTITRANLVIDTTALSVDSMPPSSVEDYTRTIDKTRSDFDSGTMQFSPLNGGLRADLARHERERILSALEKAGTQAEAAKLLGISRRTLINRLEEYEIARPRKGKTK